MHVERILLRMKEQNEGSPRIPCLIGQLLPPGGISHLTGKPLLPEKRSQAFRQDPGFSKQGLSVFLKPFHQLCKLCPDPEIPEHIKGGQDPAAVPADISHPVRDPGNGSMSLVLQIALR